jgi:hypothetical protein
MPREFAALTAAILASDDIAPADAIQIDTDKARLDFSLIHDFLARSHWATGIPADVLRQLALLRLLPRRRANRLRAGRHRLCHLCLRRRRPRA